MKGLMNEEQKELFEVFVKQIREDGYISIHQAICLLEIALNGIESKKDLTDTERLSISGIRQIIKGL